MYATDTFIFPLSFCSGDYSFEKVPIPKPGPNQVLVKVEVVGICAGDGKVMDGAERFWGKPGNAHCYFIRLNPRKKGTFKFCLPALLGIHRNSKQKEFFRSSKGFLR